MKKIYIILTIFVGVITILFLINKVDSNNKGDERLSDFEINSIQYIANEIEDYYSNYSKCDFAEFKELSIYKYKIDDNEEIVCGQVKVQRYLGYDTFTFVNYNLSYEKITSIFTASSVEKKNHKALELFDKYKNAYNNVTYLNIKECNRILHESLDRLFEDGMEKSAFQSGIFNDDYQGGDEKLLEKEFEYEICDNEVAITKWIGVDTDYVRIPSKIQGLNVTRIKTGAFKNIVQRVYDNEQDYYYIQEPCRLETVFLPDTIKYIEKDAFYNDDYYGDSNCILDYIYIPKSIEYVDSNAFAISTKVFFEGYYVNFSKYHSYYINVKEDDLLFYDGMIFKQFRNTILGPEAILVDCLYDTTIAKVPMVVSINEQVMPVTNLGDLCFSDCKQIEQITLHSNLEKVNFDAFDMNYSFLENYPKLKMTEYKNGYYIPSSTNPYYLFISLINDKDNIVFHDNTAIIYEYGISSSYNFYYNEDGIDYISSDSNKYFYGTNSYKNYNTNHIVKFNLNTKIVYPYPWVYNGTYSAEFYIPKDVRYICLTNRDSLSWSSFIVDSNNKIYSSDSYGSLYGNYGLTLEVAGNYYEDISGNRKQYIVPNTVFYIADQAFCRARYSEIILSEYTYEVGDDVFYCSGATNIYIGKSLYNLGDLITCYTYGGILNVTISDENPYYKADKNMITSKDGSILYSIYGKYHDIVFEIPSTIKYIELNAFQSLIDNVCIFIIPETVINVANSRTQDWVDIYCLGQSENYHITNAKFGKVLYINKTIYLVNEDGASLERCFYDGDIFVMEDEVNGVEVNKISYDAFANCSFKQVILGDNLKEIGGYAFSSSNIECLIIPDGVTKIGGGLFHATDIEWIVVPASVTEFGDCNFTYSTDCVIFLELESIPKGWNDRWNDSGSDEDPAIYYFKSQWHYENGIPVLNE